MQADETTGKDVGGEGRPRRVLYVDADKRARDAVSTHAERNRPAMTVDVVGDSETAVSRVTENRYDCVVGEYDLPADDGISLADRLEAAGYRGPFLLFTSHDPAAVAREAFAAGVTDFVQKRPDSESYGFLFDKIDGAVSGNEEVEYESGGKRRDIDTLVALAEAADESTWLAGDLDPVSPVPEPANVYDAVAEVLENDRTFRTHVVRNTDEDVTDPRVWELEDDGAVEHRRVELPEGDSRLDLFRDVSADYERAQRLDRFERLLDTAQDGLYALDTNGHYTYVNESMTETLGYDREEMLGKHAAEILGRGEFERGQTHVKELVADTERESEVMELSVETKTGEELPVAIHFAPLYDEADGYDGLVGVMRDVSERKERERRLRESKRRYRTLAENIPDGAVAMFDEDLQYTLVGGELFENLDYEVDDFEGVAIDEIHTEGYIERFENEYEAVFEGERAQFKFSHGEGYYRTNLVPIRDGDGNVDAGLAMVIDVTEQHEYKQQLERQNERLGQFASIVSHDLRNPLNIIEGRLQIYRERGGEEHLDVVEESLEEMGNLINDLLDLARKGQTVEEVQDVDLAEYVDHCWTGVETGDATVEVTDPGTVVADPGRFGQLLTNLFRNSVEHGSTGSQTQSDDSVEHGSTSNRQEADDSVEHDSDGVTVRVGVTDEGFFVADDGPGIPESRREDVLEYGVTDSEDGTGIGLAIVSEIAEAHGWSVTITDSWAGGARFEFAGVDS